MEKNGLEFCDPTKKIYKMIYLQHIISNINPIKNVRVMDDIFPLDTNFMFGDTRNVDPVDLHCIFGDLRTIKRIIKVEHDVSKGIWNYFIEEKCPEKSEIFKGEATFEYFTEW